MYCHPTYAHNYANVKSTQPLKMGQNKFAIFNQKFVKSNSTNSMIEICQKYFFS